MALVPGLGGSGYVALHGQVGQEPLDLRFAHFLGVPLAMKQDVAPDPIHVGLLGADAVVLEADFCTNLIEQFGLDIHNRRYFNVFSWQAARFRDGRITHRRCRR
jgi:hypothetical protein